MKQCKITGWLNESLRECPSYCFPPISRHILPNCMFVTLFCRLAHSHWQNFSVDDSHSVVTLWWCCQLKQTRLLARRHTFSVSGQCSFCQFGSLFQLEHSGAHHFAEAARHFSPSLPPIWMLITFCGPVSFSFHSWLVSLLAFISECYFFIWKSPPSAHRQ